MARAVNIIRASNAFIYLPLYMAESNHAFAQIQRPHDPQKAIEFDFQPSTRSSANEDNDINAILEMNRISSAGGIAFAVCDPMHLFDTGLEAENFRVVGALIKRPPFWVVDGVRANSIGDLKGRKIITYAPILKTGNYLGRYIEANVDNIILDPKITEVGKEIEELARQRINQERPCVAISTDILGIAKAVHKPTNDSTHCKPILYLGNEFDSFLTTAFITTAATCEEHPHVVEILLEAITKAVTAIYTFQEPVAELCQQISSNRGDIFKTQLSLDDQQTPAEPLSAEEANWIAARIHEFKLYPEDLRISKQEWTEAAQADRRIGKSAVERLVNLFDAVVDPKARLPEAGPPSDTPAIVRQAEKPETNLWQLSAVASGIFVAIATLSTPWAFDRICSPNNDKWICKDARSSLEGYAHVVPLVILTASLFFILFIIVDHSLIRVGIAKNAWSSAREWIVKNRLWISGGACFLAVIVAIVNGDVRSLVTNLDAGILLAFLAWLMKKRG